MGGGCEAGIAEHVFGSMRQYIAPDHSEQAYNATHGGHTHSCPRVGMAPGCTNAIVACPPPHVWRIRTPPARNHARAPCLGETSTHGPTDTPNNTPGVSVEIRVHTVTEELDLRAAAMLKQKAIECKLIDPLFCEDDLASSGCVSMIKSVDADLLIEWGIARQKANALLKEHNAECSDDLKRLIQSKEAFFLQLDPGVFVWGVWGESQTTNPPNARARMQ